MELRDRLAKLVASNQVTWEEACRIADSILDEGWGSPEDLQTARFDGYDEAIQKMIEIHEELGKNEPYLQGYEIDEVTLHSVAEAIHASTDITYGELVQWLAAKVHADTARLLKDDDNPFAEKG